MSAMIVPKMVLCCRVKLALTMVTLIFGKLNFQGFLRPDKLPLTWSSQQLKYIVVSIKATRKASLNKGGETKMSLLTGKPKSLRVVINWYFWWYWKNNSRLLKELFEELDLLHVLWLSKRLKHSATNNSSPGAFVLVTSRPGAKEPLVQVGEFCNATGLHPT